MSTANPQSIEDLAPSTREWLARLSAWTTRAISWVNPNRLVWVEWLVLLVVGYLYSSATLLNFDPNRLQQSGEHPESSTLPILAEIGLRRYGEIPLWNPYMLAGFPHQGDLVNHFWNPVSTLPIWLFGGIVGMKVSIFLSFLIAGLGQWVMSHVFGLRGWARLWSAVLFMLAGGLALLWRLGWYELLVGMVWFPWFFAGLWWALHRRDRVSLVLTGATIYMILTTGGGYYPLYLAVTGGVLTVMAMLFAPVGETFRVLRRALAIALIGLLLSAVAIVPWWDGLRYTARDAVPDWNQEGAQPIHYALVNYVISKIDWFGTSILGTKGGWNWFYIGWLPLVLLVLTPLAYIDSRNRQKKNILAIFVLTLAILAWFANPFTPVKLIYDFFPTLYQFRFPNRLLILATSPLLVLGGFGLQYLVAWVWRVTKAWSQSLPANAKDLTPLVSAFGLGALVLMVAFTLRDVYTVNRGFAFYNDPVDQRAVAALTWLQQQDPGYYYIDVGGANPEWKWTPVSYSLEIPTLNFQYNRRVATQDKQRSPESPFVVTAKYRFMRPDQAAPPGGQYLNEFAGFKLYQMPSALPFAFSVPESRLQSPGKITVSDVVPLSGGAQGPNRYVITGSAPEGSRLVALVSDYPGWRVFIDGQPAPLTPANGYLGVAMQPGEHTYAFVFSPILHTIGVVVSLVVLAVCLALLGLDFRQWRRSRREARTALGRTLPMPIGGDLFPAAAYPDEGQDRWSLLPDDERDVQRELRALRRENEALRASLAALDVTAAGGTLTGVPETDAGRRVAETGRMIQVSDLKRVLTWLIPALPLVLAVLPAFLVFQDRWARNQGLVEMYRGAWNRLPFAPALGLPPYFYVIFLCFALLVVIMLLMRRLPPLPLYIPRERAEQAAADGLSRLQRQVAYGLLGLSLIGALYVVGTSSVQRRQPGWDLALVLLGLLVGAFLREIPVQRVVGWLQRNGSLVVTVLVFEIALLLFMRAVATRQSDITVYGLLLGLATAVLLVNWRRLSWVFWIMQGAFIAYTYDINAWWFAAIGDEFSFYRYAREIVGRQNLEFIGQKLFWGSAVYGTHSYLSSLIQAIWMKLLGTDSFGWRISSLYLSAISLAFFYYFFKTFVDRRLAILTTIFLAASHYVMDFGKIGYNNLQALFTFGLVLMAAAWAIRSTRPLAFLSLGLSMGLCFYVYPAALYVVPIPLLSLLVYYFPRSRVAVVNWGVTLGSMILFIVPLLSQPEYWQSKTAGTMFNGPSLVENIVKATTHIGTNMLYALFSPVFAAEESHFVVMSHVDLIQAALVFIGLAYLLTRPRQTRFTVFFLLSYVALLFMVGASHDRRFPPNTRMFLMLPWYGFMATVGLTWLVERLKGLGLSERRAGWVTTLVMVAVVALNLVHAYPFSYDRNGGRYQSLEIMFLRTAQKLFTADEPQRAVAWINDPQSLHIPSLREGAEMYGLPYTPDRIKEIVVNSPTLPPTAKPILDDRNVIVAVSPRIQDAWRQPIERTLQEQGRVQCAVKNVAQHHRFDLWLPQGLEGMCRELSL